MTTASELVASCGLSLDELAHWRDLIATGSGYRRVSIPQKRRRPRQVLMPSVGLDRVLKQLRFGLMLGVEYTAPIEVHGFVGGRNIITNAEQHLGQDVVLKVDLADFFGSIDSTRVKSSLMSLGLDEDGADHVAGVSLVNNALPQGFSTSPIISNYVFLETDRDLAKFALESRVTFTRYVDDIVISGERENVNDALLASLEELLAARGWTVNQHKTRFMRRGKAQYVTGLGVGDPEGPHIPRPMKRQLRRELYFAQRFGAEDARAASPTPMDFHRLSGWVHYAASVEPFGEQLRIAWSEVAAERKSTLETESWQTLLDEIDFPVDW